MAYSSLTPPSSNPLQSFIQSRKKSQFGSLVPPASPTQTAPTPPTPIAPSVPTAATLPSAPKAPASAALQTPAAQKYMNTVAAPVAAPVATQASPQPPSIGAGAMTPQEISNARTPEQLAAANTTGVGQGSTARDATFSEIGPNAAPQTAYDVAMNNYLKSLQAANELDLQARKDQEKALETGETLGFASGEAARVNRNNAFAQEAATNLANQNLAAVTALGKRLPPAPEAFSLSPGQTRFDAQGNPIASSADIPGTSVVDVGGRKVLINDATGQTIKDLGVSTSGSSSGTDLNALLSVTEAQALGVPYGTTRGQALGSSVAGKPTAEQSKARQYAVSAENANNLLSTLEYTPGAIEVPLPNLLKGDQRQQFEQAARALVNATLRRESGATITDDEFTNKYKELIPQQGDGPGVLEQKKLARAATVKSIQEAGGSGVNNDPLGLFN